MAGAPPGEHRRARRAMGAALTVIVALAGGIALLAFFVARDDAPVEDGGGSSEVRGPGTVFPDQGDRHLSPAQRGSVDYDSDPPTSGPHLPETVRRGEIVLTNDQILHALELGNVVLVYGSGTPPAALRSLAREVSGGPLDPAVVAAGQAVVLARRPGTRGVIALAWRHMLRTPSARDPELVRFADSWLGRGAGE